MFIALIDIGGYKKGDEVPQEKAQVWLQMYDVAPVQEISGSGATSSATTQHESPSKKVEEKKPQKKMWGAKK